MKPLTITTDAWRLTDIAASPPDVDELRLVNREGRVSSRRAIRRAKDMSMEFTGSPNVVLTPKVADTRRTTNRSRPKAASLRSNNLKTLSLKEITNSMTRIFVGNVSRAATESEPRSHFAADGRIASVQIKTEQGSGRPRGFAFVAMPLMEDAEEAITRLAGVMFKEQPLTVNEARSDARRNANANAERNRIAAIFDSI